MNHILIKILAISSTLRERKKLASDNIASMEQDDKTENEQEALDSQRGTY